jgi:hypothetical protein
MGLIVFGFPTTVCAAILLALSFESGVGGDFRVFLTVACIVGFLATTAGSVIVRLTTETPQNGS